LRCAKIKVKSTIKGHKYEKNDLGWVGNSVGDAPEGMRVMRKPYNMPTFGNIDAKPLKSHRVSQCRGGVLSGSMTRKPVHLETI
jgi:hypothetical protein